MELPAKLYHVTDTAGWQRIQQEGLLPRRERSEGAEPQWPYEGAQHASPDNVVFVDPDIIVAFNSSAEAYDDPVVVEIDASGIDPTRLRINVQEVEHLMEDEMYMYNHHDQHLALIVKADPAYETLRADGYAGLEMIRDASDETNRALVEVAIEHGYSITYEGGFAPHLLRVATQEEANAAYEIWEASQPKEEATNEAFVLQGDDFEEWLAQ